MPEYCDKIKDPVARAECNKAGYAKKTKKGKGVPNEMSRVRSDKGGY